MQVVYRYSVGDWVMTSFGTKGYVTMLGYDEAGPQYYVHTGTKAAVGWYKEALLTPVAEGDVPSV